MRDAAIFLCSKTPIMAEPWAAAGVECWCVDTQHSIRKPLQVGKINFVWGDARSWCPPEGLRIVFAAAFPPCTHDTVTDARDFVLKGGNMLRDSLETFEACRMACAWSGAPYMVEHPKTMLVSIPHIGPPTHKFNPNDYGDPYTKETWLWTGNGFQMPKIVKPGDMFDTPTWVPPVEGSKMHRMTGGAEGANKRAETPRGLSNAVFWANAPTHIRNMHPDAMCAIRESDVHEGARTCDTCGHFTPAWERAWCSKRELPESIARPLDTSPVT